MAEIIVLETKSGLVVAEWEGDLDAIFDLLSCEINGPWWLNAVKGDGIIKYLEDKNIKIVDSMPSRMMVYFYGEKNSSLLPVIRLLDRV